MAEVATMLSVTPEAQPRDLVVIGGLHKVSTIYVTVKRPARFHEFQIIWDDVYLYFIDNME
jgi:hypothetical protein